MHQVTMDAQKIMLDNYVFMCSCYQLLKIQQVLIHCLCSPSTSFTHSIGVW